MSCCDSKPGRTYVEESAANMIIKPIPAVDNVYPIHTTGRYNPVLEMIKPAKTDATAADKEYESILRDNQSDPPTALSRITITLHQPPLRRLQELGNREEDKMRPRKKQSHAGNL